MALLDIQRRGQIIGRIRTGQKVIVNGVERPTKLTAFRFTTGSRFAASAVAELLGGEVRPWDGHDGQWEVVTKASEVDVMVPPRDAVISQWYEMWTAQGCARRCDSVTEQRSGKPCLCPSDPAERSRQAKLKTPQACKPVTRINVMIPDLPGLGVWLLATGSDQAAVEINDAGDLLSMARDQGIFLPAKLRLEQRETRIPGEPAKHYGVPVLEPMNTFREIATGALAAAGMTAQLPPAPGEQRRAITSGTPAPPAPAIAQPKTSEGAQAIADRAWAARTRAEVEAMVEDPNNALLLDDLVCVDGENDVYDSLRAHLQDRWKRLPAEAGAA